MIEVEDLSVPEAMRFLPEEGMKVPKEMHIYTVRIVSWHRLPYFTLYAYSPTRRPPPWDDRKRAIFLLQAGGENSLSHAGKDPLISPISAGQRRQGAGALCKTKNETTTTSSGWLAQQTQHMVISWVMIHHHREKGKSEFCPRLSHFWERGTKLRQKGRFFPVKNRGEEESFFAYFSLFVKNNPVSKPGLSFFMLLFSYFIPRTPGSCFLDIYSFDIFLPE